MYQFGIVRTSMSLYLHIIIMNNNDYGEVSHGLRRVSICRKEGFDGHRKNHNRRTDLCGCHLSDC